MEHFVAGVNCLITQLAVFITTMILKSVFPPPPHKIGTRYFFGISEVWAVFSLLYIQKKKKEKRLYLEERKIPITNMTEETVTAEIERKQMMIERWV